MTERQVYQLVIMATVFWIISLIVMISLIINFNPGNFIVVVLALSLACYTSVAYFDAKQKLDLPIQIEKAKVASSVLHDRSIELTDSQFELEFELDSGEVLRFEYYRDFDLETHGTITYLGDELLKFKKDPKIAHH